MRFHQIRIYHNTDSRFVPYQNGDRLAATVSHGRNQPADTSPEQIADWAFHVCNADLDHLETGRVTPDGEVDFLFACVYRLLRLRSLSVGDVIDVATDEDSCWLACEPFGWRRITPPSNAHGQLLTAEKVYQHIADQASRP
ncbi:hypothetical protein AB0C02_32985 [Micromonospora sp. NPDC048999]|uniref:hypothetical protein n=1 Tax=Micromonospora sp. NPDC048999 TaxID=3155391 RepID=UPI0033FA516A